MSEPASGPSVATSPVQSPQPKIGRIDGQPQPRIGRIDGHQMAADELENRRFGIEIESIYFYASDGGISCAVLLKTTFDLRGDNLRTALVPLSAVPNGSDATENINISASHPTNTEWFEVDERPESGETIIAPTIKLNAAANGVELSGFSKTKRSSRIHSYKIELDPSKDVIEGLPTLLKLKYKDEAGLFYPPSVRVLVLVEKWTDEFDPMWFPFQLNLDWKLRVDVHGGEFSAKIKRLVAKASKHEGWRFQIKAKYKPQRAMEALEDALNNNEGPSPHMHVGLRVAAKRWAESSQNLEGKGKEKAK